MPVYGTVFRKFIISLSKLKVLVSFTLVTYEIAFRCSEQYFHIYEKKKTVFKFFILVLAERKRDRKKEGRKEIRKNVSCFSNYSNITSKSNYSSLA